jgi:hypothetical protein
VRIVLIVNILKKNEDVIVDLRLELEAQMFAKGLFAGLVTSMVNVITDVISFKHFIQGDIYVKVTNISNGYDN